MSQKMPCSKCGVPILASTALRTDGLCMPCKGGYRESNEEGKRHIREQRERMLTDPYRRLWIWLVEQVHHSPSGFDGLSHPLKTIRQRPSGAKNWTTSTIFTGPIRRASLFGWKPSHGIMDLCPLRSNRREQLSLGTRHCEYRSVVGHGKLFGWMKSAVRLCSA